MSDQERIEQASAREQRVVAAFEERLGPGVHNPWLENLARMKLRQWGERLEAERHGTGVRS